jgi:putative PIN family toxin of toxin-antitoxin system
MQKAVFDTNVLVSALWNPQGTPARVISLIPMWRIVPCFDHRILAEYMMVLNRPKLKFSGDKIEAILREFEQYGISVIAPESVIPFPDESDRKFYDVAVACDAVLITGNTKHYPPADFILSPAEALSVSLQRG